MGSVEQLTHPTTDRNAMTDEVNAMDHVIVVMFENRSLDNVLGHLYGPEDGKAFGPGEPASDG